jgi:ketosteroid isomerase-like protein
MKIALLTALALTLASPALAKTALEREKEAVIAVDVLVSTATTPEAGLSTFDPDVLQDDFFPPQRKGVGEVAKDFAVYMDNYSDFKAEILDMNAEVDGTLAVVISHQHFKAKGKNGTPDLDAIIRQTDVMRKKNGQWKITYQHLSVPIDIKTGKAIFKP